MDEYDVLLKVVNRDLKDGFYVRCEASPVRLFPDLVSIRVTRAPGAGGKIIMTVNTKCVVEYDGETWCKLNDIGNDGRMTSPTIWAAILGTQLEGFENIKFLVSVENLMKIC